MIHLKRAYETPSPKDGFFVERLWPRGVTQGAGGGASMAQGCGPQPELREWFGHDLARWQQFERWYWKELKANQVAVDLLASKARRGAVTLVYAARDEEHNGALALKEFLEHRKK